MRGNIHGALSAQKRMSIRDELAACAREMAGTGEDLNPALEQAGLESLALYEAQFKATQPDANERQPY